MAKYVFSYRVPADYSPNDEAHAEWAAWFDELGSALVDPGNAVTEYGSLGGSDSRVAGYLLVSAEDMDSALALAKGCPALQVGGGVEIGPVMETAES